jgi:hypothetical protein
MPALGSAARTGAAARIAGGLPVRHRVVRGSLYALLRVDSGGRTAPETQLPARRMGQRGCRRVLAGLRSPLIGIGPARRALSRNGVQKRPLEIQSTRSRQRGVPPRPQPINIRLEEPGLEPEPEKVFGCTAALPIRIGKRQAGRPVCIGGRHIKIDRGVHGRTGAIAPVDEFGADFSPTGMTHLDPLPCLFRHNPHQSKTGLTH